MMENSLDFQDSVLSWKLVSRFSWFDCPTEHQTQKLYSLNKNLNITISFRKNCGRILTICSDVRSNNLGPRIAGAKKRKKMKPDMTEYLTSLFSGTMRGENHRDYTS